MHEHAHKHAPRVRGEGDWVGEGRGQGRKARGASATERFYDTAREKRRIFFSGSLSLSVCLSVYLCVCVCLSVCLCRSVPRAHTPLIPGRPLTGERGTRRHALACARVSSGVAYARVVMRGAD
eukprot:1168361-Rhodomonas_salina.1